MGEAGGEGGEFTGARTFFQIGEAGLGRVELVGGLALGGEFIGPFQGEERGIDGDPRTFDDRERFEPAGEGGGDIDEVPFEITLPADRGRAGAGGESEERERGGGQREEWAAHDRCSGSRKEKLQGRKIWRRRFAMIKIGGRWAGLRAMSAQPNVKAEITARLARKALGALKNICSRGCQLILRR